MHEALLFSARLRLPASVPSATTDSFVEEVGALDLGFGVLCKQRLRVCRVPNSPGMCGVDLGAGGTSRHLSDLCARHHFMEPFRSLLTSARP